MLVAYWMSGKDPYFTGQLIPSYSTVYDWLQRHKAVPDSIHEIHAISEAVITADIGGSPSLGCTVSDSGILMASRGLQQGQLDCETGWQPAGLLGCQAARIVTASVGVPSVGGGAGSSRLRCRSVASGGFLQGLLDCETRQLLARLWDCPAA